LATPSVTAANRLPLRLFAAARDDAGEPVQCEEHQDQPGHPGERTVISCGGGLVVQPGMLEALLARGVVVCLHASLETVLARTSRSRNRPLLEVENPEDRIRILYAAREPIYRRAGTMVLTDSRPLGDIVAHVVRIWQRDARDFSAVKK